MLYGHIITKPYCQQHLIDINFLFSSIAIPSKLDFAKSLKYSAASRSYSNILYSTVLYLQIMPFKMYPFASCPDGPATEADLSDEDCWTGPTALVMIVIVAYVGHCTVC